MNFTINIAKGLKKQAEPRRRKKLTSICLGTCVQVEDKYKIKVSLRNDPEFPDFILIDFTEESFNLKGKTVVYYKQKDKDGHYVRLIRTLQEARCIPISPNIFTTVVDGLVCSGHIVSEGGVHKFNLKDIHGRGNTLYNLPNNLDESVPLFK